MQFDAGHFRKCNAWLEQRYGKDGGIDWDLNVDAQKTEPEKTEPKKIEAEKTEAEKTEAEKTEAEKTEL
jgi:uracil-DNA glycosylase